MSWTRLLTDDDDHVASVFDSDEPFTDVHLREEDDDSEVAAMFALDTPAEWVIAPGEFVPEAIIPLDDGPPWERFLAIRDVDRIDDDDLSLYPEDA